MGVNNLKVSAVIPLYNAEKYIAATLDSLLVQTYPLEEIIVVDDCGSDNSVRIVEKYCERYKMIRLIRQEENRGVSAARNRGIQEASGYWILFMDADDVASKDLVKEDLEHLQKLLNKEPLQWALVYPAYQQIDQEGIAIGDIIRGKQYNDKEAFGSLLFRNQIITPSGLLINKEILTMFGGFDETLSCNEDWDLWLKVSKKFGVAYVDKPLVYVRRHPNNTTNEINKTANAEKMILQKYEIQEIKEALFKRNLQPDENRLDFISMLYRLERWDIAFKEFDLLEDKGSTKSLFLLSLYHIKMGNLLDGEKVLSQAYNQSPKHGSVINNLGVLFAIKGNENEARELFQTALKYYPNYIDAKINLEILEKGKKNYRFTWRELRNTLLYYADKQKMCRD